MPIVFEEPVRDEATARQFVVDLTAAQASPELIKAATESADAIRDTNQGGPGSPSQTEQAEPLAVG